MKGTEQIEELELTVQKLREDKKALEDKLQQVDVQTPRVDSTTDDRASTTPTESEPAAVVNQVLFQFY